ncbi:MAG: Hsp20/alpha crystallin family protein [Desulfovibrionaceae bacterium]|nr:Hsp20/alpha crystallin family protein [Desulfovibrionaceae bacterium]
MYTPHVNTQRGFASRPSPVVRPDNERRGSSYAPVLQLHDDIDRLFDSVFGMMSPWDFGFLPRLGSSHAGGAASVMPRLDVRSNEKAYTVSVELPGVQPDDVKIEVRDHVLILQGEKKSEGSGDNEACYLSERSYGSFERVLTLPEDAVADEISATHKDGVLCIAIPRKEPDKPQSRTIEIVKQ